MLKSSQLNPLCQISDFFDCLLDQFKNFSAPTRIGRILNLYVNKTFFLIFLHGEMFLELQLIKFDDLLFKRL